MKRKTGSGNKEWITILEMNTKLKKIKKKNYGNNVNSKRRENKK